MTILERARPILDPVTAHGSRVLVIEDEAVMAEVVARYLRRDGHDVRIAADGEAGLRAYREFAPDIVVLDLMLPEVDGLEVCRRIREVAQTPIIMVTARTTEVDRLRGFDLGADDYVLKPFSPRELAARVQAVLRRAQRAPLVPEGVGKYGALTIDRGARSVRGATGDIDLTSREYDLLDFMARNTGQVFSREQLIEAVWDREAVTDANAITVHVRRIREKIEEDPSRPRYLKTVWGVGYKFDA